MLNELFEATVRDLMRKQRSITRLFPQFPDRVKTIGTKGGVRLESVDTEKWTFKVHSGTEDDLWYTVIVRFLNILPELDRLIRDRRLWVSDKSRVDLRKLAGEFMDKVHIQLSCDCPAFLYWGSDYILSLSKYNAKYGDKETRPPKIRNPKQYGAYCKHIAAVMRVLPFYKVTLAKWLNDFYKKEIKKFEEETKERYKWVEPAKKELIRRREKAISKEEEEEE